ncbi:MAG: YncE family protein [Acidobacteriales bacterium]|nr:YncE family protein [Terriglobales bacterium]
MLLRLKFALSLAVLLLLTGASAAQLKQIAVIEIPGRPGFDALAFSGRYLLMAHTSIGTVEVFDTTRRRVVKQISGLSSPRGLAVDNNAGLLYIANAGNNSIAVASTKDWQIQQTFQLSMEPSKLLLVPDQKNLYVAARRAPTLALVDLNSGSEASSIQLGGRPRQMAYDPGQKVVFVSVQDTAEVVAITSAGQVARRLKLAASQPTGLAFDPAARRLYVAVRSAVLVLDPVSGAELARVPSAQGTDTLWYDDSTRNVFAAAADGSVNMIHTNGGNYFSEHELRTDVRGSTLAYDPARNFVYVPGGREGRSKLVILRRVENPDTTIQQVERKPGDQPQVAESRR